MVSEKVNMRRISEEMFFIWTFLSPALPGASYGGRLNHEGLSAAISSSLFKQKVYGMISNSLQENAALKRRYEALVGI